MSRGLVCREVWRILQLWHSTLASRHRADWTLGCWGDGVNDDFGTSKLKMTWLFMILLMVQKTGVHQLRLGSFVIPLFTTGFHTCQVVISSINSMWALITDIGTSSWLIFWISMRCCLIESCWIMLLDLTTLSLHTEAWFFFAVIALSWLETYETSWGRIKSRDSSWSLPSGQHKTIQKTNRQEIHQTTSP